MQKLCLYTGLIIVLLWPKIIQAERLFSGHEADGQSQYYLKQRYYNPTVGKFLQPDPLARSMVQEAVPGAQTDLLTVLLNPQMQNGYSYANNNPVKNIDVDGQVSKERQERFNKMSDYIRNDDSYWLVRDRDGNAAAFDLLWQKSLEINDNNVGSALESLSDAVNINWRDHKTLDKDRQEYLDRIYNLPTNISGEFGADKSYMDSLQHFVMAARLTKMFGAKLADLIGIGHEMLDGFRAWRTGTVTYHLLKASDEGYSARDVINNRLGISWYLNMDGGKTLPSDIINQYEQQMQSIWEGKPIQ